jgi:hypothetical protein
MGQRGSGVHYLCVTVGEGPSTAELWLENRDVLVLAEMIGYRFVTERGYAYDIIDLGADLSARHVSPAIVLFTKWTLPSPNKALTPPG